METKLLMSTLKTVSPLSPTCHVNMQLFQFSESKLWVSCSQLYLEELTFTPTLIFRLLIKNVYQLTSNRKQDELLIRSVSHQKLSLKVSAQVNSS